MLSPLTARVSFLSRRLAMVAGKFLAAKVGT
jgi:hypothetical protein